MFATLMSSFFFFFNDTATTEIYTLSLHDALPISPSANNSSLSSAAAGSCNSLRALRRKGLREARSEEHTSELQSHLNLVCRLLLEKKKTNQFKCVRCRRVRSTAETCLWSCRAGED